MRLAVAVIALSLAARPACAADNVRFSLAVLLSPEAAKKIESTGQKLCISASYYGLPKPASLRRADNMGQIDLGGEKITLPGNGGVAVITGSQFKARDLRYVAGKPQVNVNIFSTTNGSPNNILDCDIIDGDIPRADQDIPRLHCKLIGEH